MRERQENNGSGLMAVDGALGGGFVGIVVGVVTNTLLSNTLNFSGRTEQPDPGGFEFLAILGSAGAVLGTTTYIGWKAHQKYSENPKKAMSSSFLLSASTVVLNWVLVQSIKSGFGEDIDPFNVPIMLAGGISAGVIVGSAVLAMDSPVASLSKCASRFFQKCLPCINQDEARPTTRLNSVASENYSAA